MVVVEAWDGMQSEQSLDNHYNNHNHNINNINDRIILVARARARGLFIGVSTHRSATPTSVESESDHLLCFEFASSH